MQMHGATIYCVDAQTKPRLMLDDFELKGVRAYSVKYERPNAVLKIELYVDSIEVVKDEKERQDGPKNQNNE